MINGEDDLELLPWEQEQRQAYQDTFGSTPEEDRDAGFGADVDTWGGVYNAGQPGGDDGSSPSTPARSPNISTKAYNDRTGAMVDIGAQQLLESQRSSMASDATQRATLAETMRKNKEYERYLMQILTDVTKPLNDVTMEAMKQEMLLLKRKSYSDATGYSYTLPGEPTPPKSQMPQMLSQTWNAQPATLTSPTTGSPLSAALATLGTGGRR